MSCGLSNIHLFIMLFSIQFVREVADSCLPEVVSDMLVRLKVSFERSVFRYITSCEQFDMVSSGDRFFQF